MKKLQQAAECETAVGPASPGGHAPNFSFSKLKMDAAENQFYKIHTNLVFTMKDEPAATVLTPNWLLLPLWYTTD